ncbi:hypothetical protein E5287_02350 [Mycoplasmopsis agalactiae]|nr:hypothetical protein E5287_02350 [Mycoplasmopsis agalactiae]
MGIAIKKEKLLNYIWLEMAEIIVIQLTYDSYNMKDKINSKDEPIWCKKIFHNGLYYYAFRANN